MSDQRIVVFFHIGTGTFGGGSKMLLKLLQSLSESSIRPILLSQVDDELCKRARAANIPVEIVPFRGVLDSYNRLLLSTSPRILVPSIARILQFNSDAYKHLRYADAIWCQNVRAVLTMLPYKLIADTPVIWNIGLGLESEGMVKHLNTVALAATDYVFIESKSQAERMFTRPQYQSNERKFVVFSKGIDVETFRPNRDWPPLTKNPYAIGTAAVLTPRKGIEDFLEAAIELLGARDDVQFYIAGEPTGSDGDNYANSLQNRVCSAGVEDSVTFLGWVEDMPSYLNSLDVFVLPSQNEGIPGVVREALAMELPVIATDVGGTSDVVRSDETGVLVPPADPTAIVQAIESILGDKPAARKLGERGRRLIVNEFSLEQYTENYESFLTEVSSG